jgi:hypothetical protein
LVNIPEKANKREKVINKMAKNGEKWGKVGKIYYFYKIGQKPRYDNLYR